MRRFLGSFAILALLAGLFMAVRMELRAHRRWAPMELVLAPGAEWENITPLQRRGLALLFKDCLEYENGLPVVEEENALPCRPGARDILVLRMVRMGDQMQIRTLRRRAGKRDEILETPLQPPAKAMASALAALNLDSSVARVMVPRDPEALWVLAELEDRTSELNLAESMSQCAWLVEREPECASAWLTKARISYLYLLWNASVEGDTQQISEGDFLRALELAPNFPRAVIAFARMKSDIGNQRGALEMLDEAVQRYPRVPRLYESIAYAARTVGMLDGAFLALKRAEQIQGPSTGVPGVTENTYFYRGDVDAFEAHLGAPGVEPDSLRDFYRGYVRLLKNDRAGALAWFSRAYLYPSGIPQFEVLSKVYSLALQGKTEAALALLRRLWVDRVPLRVPDGEYTFKLAEAFGFLGSRGEAEEAATRAFAQGFGCTRWFQQTPFLAGIRDTPRWTALVQHLEGRQMLTERIFPKERFRF